MGDELKKLERKLDQQIADRIIAMERLKATGEDWWEWRGVFVGLGAVWRVFARRAVTLTSRLL